MSIQTIPGHSPAMDAALARIAREFGRPMYIGIAKKILRHGMSLVVLQARYGARARQYGRRGLDGAIEALDHQYREEKRAIALARACALHRSRLLPLPYAVTCELRLVLRWKRRYDANAFPRSVDAVLGRYVEAAE